MKQKKTKTTRRGLLSEFFDESFFKPFNFYSFKIKGSKTPVTDFSETKTLYKLDLQCPGYKSSDLKVELKGHILLVSGLKKSSHQEKQTTYLFKESSLESFKRAFTLPKDANVEKVTCKMQDGILHLKIKKLAKLKPKSQQKEIPINR